MSGNPTEYEKSGVEARKELTKAALKAADLDEGLFPNAFCKIYPTRRKHVGIITHVDGAGSKSIVNYLMYKEHNDPAWIRHNAFDVVAMNVDDVICVGSDTTIEPWYFSNYIAINKLNCDKKAVISELVGGYKNSIEVLNESGLRTIMSGGETADLPDQVGTFDFSGNLTAYVGFNDVITGEKIAPGDLVVGLHSDGKARHEEGENSGMMSNGLTVTRLKLLSNEYQKKYPEIARVPVEEGRYKGIHSLDEHIDSVGMTLGEAITSPTRLFAPAIAGILYECDPHGLVHITGGGWTKPLSLGRNVCYDLKLGKIAPWFEFLQKEAGIPWNEMPQDYNLGIGFMVIVKDTPSAENVISISESHGIRAEIIGMVEKSDKNKVKLELPAGKFEYS